MVVTANAGPYIGFGITLTASQAVQQYNEDRAPSTFDLGQGLMDPRQFYRYEPGASVNINSSSVVGAGQWQTFQLWDNAAYVDYVPATLSASNVAAASANNSSAINGAIPLLSTGAGATGTTIVAPETGTAVSVVCIDSTAAFVSYGQTGAVAAWNPAGGTGRTLLITTSSSGDTGTVSVAGRDMYGFKMTELIQLSTATNTGASSNSSGYKWPGYKAFKYVSAVTQASSTVTSTGWSVGVRDTYGFPAYLPYCGYNSQVYLMATAFSTGNAIVPLSSANITLASTAATQTSTTPDVRGTFASTTASNGTVRIQFYQGFDGGVMSKMGNLTSSAVFGGTQFSSV